MAVESLFLDAYDWNATKRDAGSCYVHQLALGKL